MDIQKRSIRRNDKRLRMEYGFLVDPSKSIWTNAKIILGDTPFHEYLNKPRKMGFHNLCKCSRIPPMTGQLLGLGPKFRIQRKIPSTKALDNGIDRFKHDIRLAHEFAGAPLLGDFHKKIYLKSDYLPETWNPHLEFILQDFENELRTARNRVIKHSKGHTNLTRLQQRVIKDLQNNPNITILICDKNLGPAIMDRNHYIECVLKEHLLANNSYKQLSTEEARFRINKTYDRIYDIIYDEEKWDKLSEEEQTFFDRLFDGKRTFRDPQFYGSPKVHKEMKKHGPPLRPVISQCGSFLAYISSYLDHWFQPIMRRTTSYIKDSGDFIRQLKAAQPFPSRAKLVTSDATAMYVNIDPGEGIITMQRYFKKYEADSPLPFDLLIPLLVQIMRNNVFQFGDTWWLQRIGTAMGTPVACAYATIFFAFFEQTFILPTYKQFIKFYKRQIDDIFLVWMDDSSDPLAFERFKSDLNAQCKLEWVTTDRKEEQNFLDLTIGIKQGIVSAKTYQKPMNLFLYIPANSAHPPSSISSLVYGLLKTYREQNSNLSDFFRTTELLFNRLLDRGYKKEGLRSVFMDCIKKLEIPSRNHRSSLGKSNLERIFFHIPYQPVDIARKTFRTLYERVIGSQLRGVRNPKTGCRMDAKRFTVCYHKDSTLRSALIRSKLKEIEGKNVSNILSNSYK